MRSASGLRRRVERLDWTAIEAELTEHGFARVPRVLTGPECKALAALYEQDDRFRKRVDMGPLRFGVGDYSYFRAPLPPLVNALRALVYPCLAPIANGWMASLGDPRRFPPTLRGLERLCARHGQRKPTPLLLRYGPGGYNCLHQDLYGAVAFPLQLTVFLSRRDAEYQGGEFLLVESRPRMQSIGQAIAGEQGEMVIFAVRERPVTGRRGVYRVKVRHGVSRVTGGRRYALGVIFHDAR